MEPVHENPEARPFHLQRKQPGRNPLQPEGVIRMDHGGFRFIYLTEKHQETVEFYTEKLGFQVLHAWDRNENDKGSLLKAGGGRLGPLGGRRL